MTLSGKAAIAGIGATDFSKNSGRSELRLAVEAVRAALTDAGLEPSDVDGLVTFTMDSNAQVAVARERWRRILASQPAHVQQMLLLRYMGETYEQIAVKLGVHERTVRKLIDQALKKLSTFGAD